MIMHALHAHPETPPETTLSISAIAVRTGTALTLQYQVEGDRGAILLSVRTPGQRRDGLWQATCFEAFVQAVGVIGYHEFNFSPSSDWASYSFDAHRAGMRDAPAQPVIAPTADGMTVTLDLSDYPDLAGADWQVGLSAVIEEKDGTKSYWALKHPEGAPDFHDAACFVLELPAVG